MVEDFVLVEKQRRIEIGLAGSPEALPPKTSRVIRIVVSEEYMLAKEVISLEFFASSRRDSLAWGEECQSIASQLQGSRSQVPQAKEFQVLLQWQPETSILHLHGL